LEGSDGPLEIEYLPSAEHKVEETQAGDSSSRVTAGDQSDQTRPMKSIGSENKEMVFAPRSMPWKIDEEDSDLEADQDEEQDC
jgi:hypothetical protein